MLVWHTFILINPLTRLGCTTVEQKQHRVYSGIYHRISFTTDLTINMTNLFWFSINVLCWWQDGFQKLYGILIFKGIWKTIRRQPEGALTSTVTIKQLVVITYRWQPVGVVINEHSCFLRNTKFTSNFAIVTLRFVWFLIKISNFVIIFFLTNLCQLRDIF